MFVKGLGEACHALLLLLLALQASSMLIQVVCVLGVGCQGTSVSHQCCSPSLCKWNTGPLGSGLDSTEYFPRNIL